MKELLYPFFICLNELLGPQNGKIDIWFIILRLKIKILLKITKRDQCSPTQTPSSGKNSFSCVLKIAWDNLKIVVKCMVWFGSLVLR